MIDINKTESKESFFDKYNFSIEYFNTKKLKEITNFDTPLVISTLKIMNECLKKDICDFNNALKKRSSYSLKQIAHKVKPNFQLIGLDNFQIICNTIETSEEWPLIKKLVMRLIVIIPEIILKIDIELNNYE